MTTFTPTVQLGAPYSPPSVMAARRRDGMAVTETVAPSDSVGTSRRSRSSRRAG
ncbi:hypothetical protein [Streptomyces sp. NBC_00154]|uniref:hypothetical protein n=1 Tax=Streptomyces sp. NBC_00154 TaxID=2975670 RepID=UPI00224FE58E|nr:hypothetical protein [Streptomyces sp. NBC_00154]